MRSHVDNVGLFLEGGDRIFERHFNLIINKMNLEEGYMAVGDLRQ